VASREPREIARRFAAIAAIAALACRGSREPPASARVAPALVAALGAADRVRAPWRCAALDTPVLPAETLALGDRTWTARDRTLRLAGDRAEIVVGVVADAGGAAPATLAALGRMRARFEASAVDVVVALGGLGANERELAATLGVLGDRAPWPIVALPGDLEPEPAHRAAIAAARARGAAVFDARLVRWIELGGLAIATIPGAGASARLAAGDDGCSWRDEDVAAVYAALAKRDGLRVVATAEAPRERGGGEPSGELALVVGDARPIDVMLHGPTRGTPSPPTRGDRDGKAIALSPGTSDASPRLPTNVPSAGLLVARGTAWSWRPLLDDDKTAPDRARP
jgi:hypothetical protein